MTATTGFVTFLVVTLGLLGGAVATGLRAQRRRHIPIVLSAVASLGFTIYYAEQLGHAYDLEAAGRIYPIHIFFAKLATLSYLLPIATGIATIRNATRRPLHRRVAFLVLALTVVTAITGTWMILAAEPLPANP